MITEDFENQNRTASYLLNCCLRRKIRMRITADKFDAEIRQLMVEENGIDISTT